MAMRTIRGQQTLMRVFIGESDKSQGKPLYEAILHLLREEGIAGATVLRAVAGFGANSVVHTANVLRLSVDLPIVIEVVDATDRIEAVLPQLDERIGGGLITLEKVEVIMHRAEG